MKVYRDETQFAFTPFSIIIKVESEEEARALYAIFNRSKNTRLFPSNGVAEALKDAVGRQYYTKPGDGVIANGITYGQFYGDKDA